MISPNTDAWIRTVSRENAAQAVNDERCVPVIVVDEIIHTDEHPFCGDWRCPCHFDEDHVWQYHTQPYRSGLLTWEEAGRLLYGQQV